MAKEKLTAAQKTARVAAQELEPAMEPLRVKADEVTAVGEDGSEVPLTELEPELKGETVTVEPEAAGQKMYTAEEVAEIARKAAEEAVAAAMAGARPTQVVQYADAEKVHFLWQAEVADDNTVYFGEGGMYGSITGKTGSFYVPKTDLSRILTPMVRQFLKDRWLLVLGGLDEDEKEALGVDYRDGEVLDRKSFARMVELGEKMLDIYPALCEGNKVMVAQRYADAFAQGSACVTRDVVVKLNELSKRPGHEKGDFVGIIEEMNARDAQ